MLAVEESRRARPDLAVRRPGPGLPAPQSPPARSAPGRSSSSSTGARRRPAPSACWRRWWRGAICSWLRWADAGCTRSPPGRWPWCAAAGRRRDRDAGRQRPVLGAVRDAERRREAVLLTLEHLLGADWVLADCAGWAYVSTRSRARRWPSGSATRWASCTATRSWRATSRRTTCSSRSAPATGPSVLHRLRLDGVPRAPGACMRADGGLGHSAAEFGEPPNTRAADAYKLGLVILRLFARSHDARAAGASSAPRAGRAARTAVPCAGRRRA